MRYHPRQHYSNVRVLTFYALNDSISFSNRITEVEYHYRTKARHFIGVGKFPNDASYSIIYNYYSMMDSIFIKFTHLDFSSFSYLDLTFFLKQ